MNSRHITFVFSIDGDVNKLLNVIIWNLPEMKNDLCDKMIYKKIWGLRHIASPGAIYSFTKMPQNTVKSLI